MPALQEEFYFFFLCCIATNMIRFTLQCFAFTGQSLRWGKYITFNVLLCVVFREFCHQYGGCKDAGSSEQEGAREVPWSDKEIPSGICGAWNPPAAHDEV